MITPPKTKPKTFTIVANISHEQRTRQAGTVELSHVKTVSSLHVSTM